jgi:3-dehydroquinate synthase
MTEHRQQNFPWEWGNFTHLASSFIAEHPFYQNIAIISDDHVFHLYGEKLKKELRPLVSQLVTYLFPPGEISKTLETVSRGWQKLIDAKFDRKSLIITLGGGVVSDIGGFIAATYMRGIDVVHIPTSLEGMVDGAFGGKNGFNWENKKNLIGTFHLPKKVFLDLAFLSTLSDRDFKAGLAEVIKYGVIGDPPLFEYLENYTEQILKKEAPFCKILIEKSCQVKHHITTQDIYDHDIRAHLNYGHTFGHAIETMHPSLFRHGEAVAMGMSCAAHLGVCLGTTKKAFVKRQDALCEKLGLSIALPSMPRDLLIDLMKQDKKSVGSQLSFIIPHDVGKVSRMDNVSDETVAKALENKVNDHECD